MTSFHLFLACLTLLACGCNLQPQSPAKTDYVPLISASIGVTTSSPVQVVAPAPDGPESLCKNCKGRGKIGDGTTMVTCPVCGGTGKGKSSGESNEEPPQLPPSTEATEDQKTPPVVEENFKPDDTKVPDAPKANPVVAVIYTARDFHCPGCVVVEAEVAKLHKDYGWNPSQIKIVPLGDEEAAEMGLSVYPTLEVRSGDRVLLRKAGVFSASQLTTMINPHRLSASSQ